MRDVGEIGENVLAQWAAQVGITANRIQRDRTGWDFMLELPAASPSRNKTVPIDRREHPIQCLVQVKSSDSRPGRWDVKLDNWLRFVTTPLPAFFLVLEFDGQNQCQRAFLVHVDEELIRKVLTRVRKLSVSSSSVPLHTRTMMFRYGPEHVLGSMDGIGLLEAINRCVPSLPAYTDGKQQLVRTVGYEAGGQLVSAQLTIPADASTDAEDIFVDWALGLVGGAVIAPGAEVYDERFGIRLPDPVEVIHTQGRLEPQPRGRGLLKFRSLDGQQERTYEVEIYSSAGVAGYVSDDKHKVRIATPFGDLFIPFRNPTATQLVLRVPHPDLTVSAADLLPLSDFVLLCHGSSSTGGLEFHLRTDGPALSGVVNFSTSLADQLVQLAKATRYCLHIASRLGLPNSLPTTVNQLYREREPLELMDAALRKDTLGARVSFACPSGTVNEGQLVCLPSELIAHIAGYVWIVGVGYVGYPEPTGSSEGGFQEFEMPVSFLERCYAEALKTGAVPKFSIAEMVDHLAAVHPTATILQWWDWADRLPLGSDQDAE